jgi:ligand-binding sensor domain-containing protein
MKNLAFFILMLVSAIEYVAAQSPFFKSVRLEETATNAESHLVYESEEGFLYFGTTEGLFAYDGVEFTPFSRPQNTENEVTAIFQSRNKTLWIGYRDGAIFHLQKQKIIQWQPEEGTPAVSITGFIEDSLGQLWIATYGEGLYCHDGQRLYNFATEDGLGGNDIYTLAADKSNNVYAGTDSGISVCSFTKGDKKFNNITRDEGLSDNRQKRWNLDRYL